MVMGFDFVDLFKYERSRGRLFWAGSGHDGLLGGVLLQSDVL